MDNETPKIKNPEIDVLKLLAENLSDVAWIIPADLNAKMTWITPSVLQLRGYTDKEAAQMRVEEGLTPASYELALQVLYEEMIKESSGEADPKRTRVLELEVLCKDGTTKWTEAKISMIRNIEGEITHFLGISRDISERKTAEALNKRLLEIIDATPDFVGMLSAEGNKPVYHNVAARRMLGITIEEDFQKEIFNFMTPETKDNIINEAIPALIEVGNWHGEGVYLNKDGKEIPVLITMVAHRDEQGIPKYFSTISHDISGLKETEQQLVQAQKMEAIGTLAGGIAHDFNNLLTVILSCADFSSASDDIDTIHADIKEIMKASRRAADLVKQLLAFSRKQPLELKVVDLNDAVKDIQKLLINLLGEDIKLIIKPGQISGVNADISQIGQIIMNLAINARDAMTNGGKLTIETKGITKGKLKYASITVTDDGEGISEENLLRIFDPFFTTKEVGSGTGLGLSVVYGIVKQHGGDVTVESKVGKGTAFKILIPVAKTEDLPQIQELPATKKIEKFGTGKTAVVIEDEEMVARLNERILKGAGFTVIQFKTADEARIYFDNLPEGQAVDLILSDVRMPGTKGDDFKEEMIGRGFKGLFVLMSGYNEAMIDAENSSDPSLLFLSKPTDPKELLNFLRDAFSKKADLHKG